MKNTLLSTVACAALLPAAATADTKPVSGVIPFELNFEAADFDGGSDETTVYGKIEPDFAFRLGEGFNLNLGLTLEPVGEDAARTPSSISMGSMSGS